MEISKISRLINEAVELDDMIEIVEEDIFLEGEEFSEDVHLLVEENKSKAFDGLKSKIESARDHIKTGNVSKGTLSGLLAGLTVAVVSAIALDMNRKKENLEEGYISLNEISEAGQRALDNLTRKLDQYDAEYTRERDERRKLRKERDEQRAITDKRNATKKKRKMVGMGAIIVSSITVIVTYANACKKRGISVTAPVKSALNRVKNIFKSAKSKNPDNAGQYDSMIDRIDSAINKIDEE